MTPADFWSLSYRIQFRSEVSKIKKDTYRNILNFIDCYPNEEVDHEANIEGEVDLLTGVLMIGDTVLHPLLRGVPEVDQQAHHGQDEHTKNLTAYTE